jgi:hypothetical protein
MDPPFSQPLASLDQAQDLPALTALRSARPRRQRAIVDYKELHNIGSPVKRGGSPSKAKK